MPQADWGRPRARLITTAWGDRYVGELFDITLAAALAPGNLPAVVELLDCDVVILTEAARFDQLRKHPVFRGIERLCPVELRPVDEFVSRPDAYGMALTYALFRGFEDLGDEMVDVHLLFLNSDFVLADGSLRTVARKIIKGERLILAPSYCVVGEIVRSELDRRRDSETATIAIPARELAALGIPNRHNTIRGKTINQQLFSMEWIDQFYWLVDQETILGRQLPIAVVSMRPEHVLTEMVTFWDYGIISHACPTTPRCIIADSDDFQMIELRSADTARDQIRLGRPAPEQIARKLYRFVTADPIELARHTLVWHSADLPPDLSQADDALDHYVDAVVSYLPKPMDYRDHHIWRYHYPTFQKLRGTYLANQGTPVPWNVEELVEYPPHPGEEVLDAAFIAASAGIARHTAAVISYDRESDGSRHVPPSESDLPDLKPVWRALDYNDQGRVLLLSSHDLSVRLFGARNVSPVEFDGLPPSMDAYLSHGTVGSQAQPTVNRLSLEDSCDLCLCEIDTAGLLHLRDLLTTLSHVMHPGSKIYLFYVNPKSGPLTMPGDIFVSEALALEFPARVYFIGAQSGSLCTLGPKPDSDRLAASRSLLNFLRHGSRRYPTEIHLSVFGEPPDRCLGMIAKIDVTVSQTGPFLVIKPRAPRLIRTRMPVDISRPLLSAGQRAIQELGSKLLSVSVEKDNLIAERARLGTELSAVRAAYTSRIKQLEDQIHVVTEAATKSAQELQSRAETDYQILMAQQQMLAGMKDADPQFFAIYEGCKDYTMTSVERLYALYKSVEYIVKAGLKGDFVETGVWRGGSCMLIAETLIALGDTSRRIFLFDTFEGHPQPDAEKDVDIWGNRAIDEWGRHEAEAKAWAFASIDEARANMARTNYPPERLSFVKGMIEDTIPQLNDIGTLALMRLDTDWYQSARVSLEQLFPRLAEGGVLIMDDYGHYKGQRQALDEYLLATNQHLLLNRIDYSCRIAVKGRNAKTTAERLDTLTGVTPV